MIKNIKDKTKFYEQVKNRVHSLTPVIDRNVFIAKNAIVIGEVKIKSNSSIWFNCTVRGDVNDISIGRNTNIQDGAVIHVSSTLQGTYIGDNVTVGHGAILHACTIEDNVLIGMQACIMDGALVEKNSIVAAGALLTPNKIVKSGELWAGKPAKFVRKLTDEEKIEIDNSAKHYIKLTEIYLQKNDI